MNVRILLFAAYADLAGTSAVDLNVQPPMTVRGLLARLRDTVPGAAGLPERPLVAINQVHTRLDAPVQDGDEVALLPPMAGG